MVSVSDLLTKSINLELGKNLVDFIESEEDLISSAMELACIDYWRSFPHQYQKFYDFNSFNNGSFQESFITILDGAFPSAPVDSSPNPREYCYYSGVMSCQVTSMNNMPMTNSSYIESQLLGIPRGGMSGFKHYPVNIMQINLSNTYEDIVAGSADITMDNVNQIVKYIVANSYGQMRVIHGIGFTTWDFVPIHNLDIATKLCMKRILDSIITVRNSLQLQTDFTIDSSFLQEKLTKVEEYINEKLKDAVFMYCVWD